MPENPLEDIPIFHRLTSEEMEEIEEILEPASFRPGESIIEEGGPEERLYILTSGTIEVHKQVLPGRRQLLAVMHSPTVVGEMGLLTEPRAAASVVAKTRVEARSIPRDNFLEMLDEDSPAACKVVYEIGRALAERMAATDDSVSRIVSELERANPRSEREMDVFQDRLIEEWMP